MSYWDSSILHGVKRGTHARTHARTDGRTDARTDGRTDGRTDARTHGRTHARTEGGEGSGSAGLRSEEGGVWACIGEGGEGAEGGRAVGRGQQSAGVWACNHHQLSTIINYNNRHWTHGTRPHAAEDNTSESLTTNIECCLRRLPYLLPMGIWRVSSRLLSRERGCAAQVYEGRVWDDDGLCQRRVS